MGSCVGKSRDTTNQPIVAMPRDPNAMRPASKDKGQSAPNKYSSEQEAHSHNFNPNSNLNPNPPIVRGQQIGYSNENLPPKAQVSTQKAQAVVEGPKQKENLIDEDAEAVFVNQLNKHVDAKPENKSPLEVKAKEEVIPLSFPNPAFTANVQSNNVEATEVKEANVGSREKISSRGKDKRVKDIINNPDELENGMSSPEPVQKKNKVDDEDDFDV